AAIEPGTLVELPTVGRIVVLPTPAVTNAYEIASAATPIERVIGRAAHKVHEAAPQLAATSADLRVAVVFGTREGLPSSLAPWVASQADDRFPGDEVDWVVVVN